MATDALKVRTPKIVVDPRLISNAAGCERDARRARKYVEALARARGWLPEDFEPEGS